MMSNDMKTQFENAENRINKSIEENVEKAQARVDNRYAIANEKDRRKSERLMKWARRQLDHIG